MLNQYDIIFDLTSRPLSNTDRSRLLNDFAFEFGWRPSDRLDEPVVDDFSNAHLVVEHGLENTAVITFFKNSRRYTDLNHTEQHRLLSISYNNLVDWHVQVEFDKVTFVFNRTKPLKSFMHDISRDNLENLRGEAFEQLTGKRPNPNLRALDEALISTISDWKRVLSAELNSNVTNSAFSALFNAIIFTRAVEDHFRRTHRALNGNNGFEPHGTVLESWKEYASTNKKLSEFIKGSLDKILKEKTPNYLIDVNQLKVFDNLGQRTISALFSDFYKNKFAPYDYDFSLISKHALSRIYEHYASILQSKTLNNYHFSQVFQMKRKIKPTEAFIRRSLLRVSLRNTFKSRYPLSSSDELN